MFWTDRIRSERDRIEEMSGVSPRYLIVRQEVWFSLKEEIVLDGMFDFDGLVVAVTDNLMNPFEFAFCSGDLEIDGKE